MHIISRKKLREFWETHPDSYEALNNWYKFVNKAKWNNLIEVQAVYSTAESVGNFTVFNIEGNKYRLTVSINYEKQVIYVKYILTHAEDDKDK